MSCPASFSPPLFPPEYLSHVRVVLRLLAAPRAQEEVRDEPPPALGGKRPGFEDEVVLPHRRINASRRGRPSQASSYLRPPSSSAGVVFKARAMRSRLRNEGFRRPHSKLET